MISLRLPPDMEDQLKRLARREKISRTEVVKRALSRYFSERKNKVSPYDLGKDLFGRYGSGQSDRSSRYRSLVREKMDEKHSR